MIVVLYLKNTNIFTMSTVVTKNRRTCWALQECGLISITVHIIQHNTTSALSIVSTAMYHGVCICIEEL